MKIDIHTHTKKCKSGDAPTREISPDALCRTVLCTEVRIIAITNHNVFDLEQFKAIESNLDPEAQVWPGIELDIVEDGSRGHLLVIVSPTLAKDFSGTVDEFTTDSSPDSFTTTIDEVLEKFDSLEPLYVAHYGQKKRVQENYQF
jgi:predicted metal-dependent phosphoesterase TrpH